MQEGVTRAGGPLPSLLCSRLKKVSLYHKCLHRTGCQVCEGPKLRSGAPAVRREEQAPGGQPAALPPPEPRGLSVDLGALP